MGFTELEKDVEEYLEFPNDVLVELHDSQYKKYFDADKVTFWSNSWQIAPKKLGHNILEALTNLLDEDLWCEVHVTDKEDSIFLENLLSEDPDHELYLWLGDLSDINEWDCCDNVIHLLWHRLKGREGNPKEYKIPNLYPDAFLLDVSIALAESDCNLHYAISPSGDLLDLEEGLSISHKPSTEMAKFDAYTQGYDEDIEGLFLLGVFLENMYLNPKKTPSLLKGCLSVVIQSLPQCHRKDELIAILRNSSYEPCKGVEDNVR
jgi:hypothetical protein